MAPIPTEARELFDGQAHLYHLTFNYVNSMSLKCAVDLGIADIIHRHKRPITLPELVSALEIHEPIKTNCLRRLMRLLVHTGLFAATKVDPHGNDDHQEDGQELEAYALTPSSKMILKDKPYSLSPYVLLSFHSPTINTFNSLGSWFKGNELTAFENACGMSYWDYTAQNPEYNNIFNQAMACDSETSGLVLKDCKPIFEGLSSLVDVGGGTGTFCKNISEAFPGIKCTVFDLPHVVANLPDTENLKFVGGDMFIQSIPPADAILLKLLLHVLGDEESLKVLKQCREAIRRNVGGGKLIIIDIVINEKKEEHELTETKLLYDLLMMVHSNGKERSEKDWERLFLEAGFSHYNITPIFGLRSVIEVYP